MCECLWLSDAAVIDHCAGYAHFPHHICGISTFCAGVRLARVYNVVEAHWYVIISNGVTFRAGNVAQSIIIRTFSTT